MAHRSGKGRACRIMLATYHLPTWGTLAEDISRALILDWPRPHSPRTSIDNCRGEGT